MNQVEFEKRRAAQIKVIGATIDNRTMKIIDFVDLLLELEPSQLIVLPGGFVEALKNPDNFRAFVSIYPGMLLNSSRTEESKA